MRILLAIVLFVLYSTNINASEKIKKMLYYQDTLPLSGFHFFKYGDSVKKYFAVMDFNKLDTVLEDAMKFCLYQRARRYSPKVLPFKKIKSIDTFFIGKQIIYKTDPSFPGLTPTPVLDSVYFRDFGKIIKDLENPQSILYKNTFLLDMEKALKGLVDLYNQRNISYANELGLIRYGLLDLMAESADATPLHSKGGGGGGRPLGLVDIRLVHFLKSTEGAADTPIKDDDFAVTVKEFKEMIAEIKSVKDEISTLQEESKQTGIDKSSEIKQKQDKVKRLELSRTFLVIKAGWDGPGKN